MTTSSTHPIALTIGTFDGVHRGHQALVAAARGALLRAGHATGEVVVLTFDQHPASVLASVRSGTDVQPPATLTRPSTRASLLRAAGADRVDTIKVDEAFFEQSAEAFLERHVLPHAPVTIAEGPDFRFGRGRGGDVAMLERVCSCPVVVVDEVMASLADGQQVPVRSGRVRWLLQAGRVREAGALLGRAPMLDGVVVQGAQRGRDLGWPTANLDCSGLLVPMDGVYAGVGVTPDGRRYRAGVSIGTNPTFGESGRTVEAHFLDFDGPVGAYDWPLQLELHAFVREQITCSDVDELCALISRDLRTVRATVSAGDYAFAP